MDILGACRSVLFGFVLGIFFDGLRFPRGFDFIVNLVILVNGGVDLLLLTHCCL